MSSGCGLKNSGCPDKDQSSDSNRDDETNNNNNNPDDVATILDGLSERFIFVDNDATTGLWSTTVNYVQEILCPVGGIVVFHYPMYWHDVVSLPHEEAYKACDVSTFNLLSPQSFLPDEDGTQPTILSQINDISYYYHCSEPNTTAYVTCSVPGHCARGQKIMIRTSATQFAYNVTTMEWDIHVQSMSRLLRLLNFRQNNNNDNEKEEIFVMDHGYQTEQLAEATLELIWCAMDHCPTAAWDISPNATLEDCESMVYTLMGFVSRKRPIPQWNISETYYRNAIERGGMNECTARSYLSQLYWSRTTTDERITSEDDNDRSTVEFFYEMAQNETMALCDLCAVSEPLLVQQVYRSIQDDTDKASWWPTLKACESAFPTSIKTTTTPPSPTSSPNGGNMPGAGDLLYTTMPPSSSSSSSACNSPQIDFCLSLLQSVLLLVVISWKVRPR